MWSTATWKWHLGMLLIREHAPKLSCYCETLDINDNDRSKRLWRKNNPLMDNIRNLMVFHTYTGMNKILQLTSIECVRLTSSNSQIQNKRATKGFILIRHKRYQIYTCLQLSSSVASFVWKPAHFELRSYGGAWYNTKIAFVEKYTLISWFLAILGV